MFMTKQSVDRGRQRRDLDELVDSWCSFFEESWLKPRLC